MPNDDMISRSAAIEEVEQWAEHGYDVIHWTGIKAMLETQPAIDAVPVEHGQWEFCGDDDIVCSQCGARYFKKRLMYAYYTGPGSDPMDGFWHCPHCGALLDGGGDTRRAEEQS